MQALLGFSISTLLIILHFNVKVAKGQGGTEEGLCGDPPVNCEPPGHPTAPNGETMLEGLNQYPARKNQAQSNSTDGNPPNDGACPYTSKDGADLLILLDKMVNNFYARNDNGRTSGTPGLRVLKGQLDHMLSEPLPSNLKATFERLQKSSGEILEQVGSGELRNPIRSWGCPKALPKHFQEFPNIGKEKEVLDSSLNARCQTSLARDCSIPEDCRDAYLTEVHSQYMLTHQVVFQLDAEQRSCSSMEEFKNGEKFRERLCSKAYLEAEFLESHNFPTRFIDLFAEQVGFCGLMGYPNFMRSDWLREIMSWQEGSASGCVPDVYGREKPMDTVIRVEGRDGVPEEDCLAHLTFVSMVAFSVNLRYMVDVCEPSLFDDYFKTYA